MEELQSLGREGVVFDNIKDGDEIVVVVSKASKGGGGEFVVV